MPTSYEEMQSALMELESPPTSKPFTASYADMISAVDMAEGRTAYAPLPQPKRTPPPPTELNQSERRSVMDSSWTVPADYIGEAVKSVPRGAANTAIAGLGGALELAVESKTAPESMASAGLRLLEKTQMGRKFAALGLDSELADKIDAAKNARRPLDSDVIDLIDQSVKAGQEGVEKSLPVTPGFEDSWTRKGFEGLGSAGVFLPAALGGGPAIAAVSAATGKGATYRAVREMGASQDDARLYSNVSALVSGATEPAGAAMSTIKILKRTDKATKGWFAKTILGASGKEGGTEILQEIPDEVARQAYLKERTLFDSLATLAEVGVLGGTIGGFMGGVAATIKAVVDRGNAKILEDYEQRVEAGQPDPTPSRETFKEAGYENGGGTRKERAAIIEALKPGEEELSFAPESERLANVRTKEGEPNVESQGKTSQGQQAKKGQAIEAQGPQGEVNDVLGAPGEPIPVTPGDVDVSRIAAESRVVEQVKKTRKRGLNPSKVYEKELDKIVRTHGEMVLPENSESEGAFEHGSYVFRDTPQNRSAAKEVRDRLPPGVQWTTKIRFVKPGHKLYAHANGADAFAEIGADSMAAAIKRAAGGEGRSKYHTVANNILNTPEMFPVGSAEWYAARSWQVGQQVKGDKGSYKSSTKGGSPPTQSGIFGQPIFDPTTGSQRDLPLAARQESNLPDVKQRIGEAFVREHQDHLKDVWAQATSQSPPAEPPSQATTSPKPQGRPDLANPGIAQPVRDVVTEVDIARNARGEPAPQTVEGHKAEAQRRLSENYAGELNAFLNAEVAPLGPVETWIVRSLIETETLRAQTSGNEAQHVVAQNLIDKYRDSGAEEARGFAARRDLVETPAQRMATALTEPPEKVQVEIDRLKAEKAKEQKRKKSGISKRVEAAKAEFQAASDELGRFLKGPLGANKFAHPKFAILVAKYVKSFIKSGGLQFADLVSQAVQSFGESDARDMVPELQKAWDAERKTPTVTKKKIGKSAPVGSPELAPAFRTLHQQELGIPKPITPAETKGPTTGPQSKMKFVTKQDEQIDKLRRGWAVRSRAIRKQLEAVGYDIEAVLEGKADHVAAMQAVGQAEAMKSSKADKFYEYWISSILSGPLTQIVNLSGSIYSLAKRGVIDRLAEATIATAARKMGLREGGAQFGELKAFVRGTYQSIGLALRNAAIVWKTDMAQFNAQRGISPSSIYDYRSPKIAGMKGRVIRTPLRALVAVDDMMKTLIAGGETAALAYRTAKEEGLSGADLEQRMSELINDPTSIPYEEGTRRAIEYSFQEETPTVSAVTGFVRKHPGVAREVFRYKIPFVVTLSNLLRLGIRSSPVGSLSLAYRLIRAAKTGNYAGIDARVAEQVVGIGVMLALAGTIDDKDPWITGTEDRNHPQSVRLGGQWYSYARIEPMATMLGITLDTLQKWRRGGDVMEIVAAPFESVLKQIDTKSFMEGVSDILKAFEYRSINPILEWAAKFPASWIPNLIKQPIRLMSDEVPERRVYGKGVERLQVMAKRGLQATEMFGIEFPKYDLWGRKVPRDGGPLPNTDFLFRVLSPSQVKPYQDTIGDRVIQSWNANHPDDPITRGKLPPQRDYKFKGKTFYMNDAEYDEYVRTSGEKSMAAVLRYHYGEKGFKAQPFDLENPTESQRKRIEKIIDDSRESAKHALLLKKKDAA